MMMPALIMYLLNDYMGIHVPEIAYIDRVAKYWMWFLIGMILVEFEDKIKKVLEEKTILKNLWNVCNMDVLFLVGR